MKTTFFVFGALLWNVSGCFAQANPPPLEFSPPLMQLRAELKLDAPPPPVVSPFLTHSFDTNSADRNLMASRVEEDGALQSYNARSDRLYLVPALETPPATPLARTLDSIAGPEEVQLGNKRLSCSFVTAAKRKNPFCLINATVLKLTW